MAHSYRSVASAKLAVRKAGNLIEEEGTPSDFGPLVFGFTGSGNVAQVWHQPVLWRDHVDTMSSV